MNTIAGLRSGALRGWPIACGVFLIIAGILCVVMPGIAALATVLVLGWALVFSGVLEIVYAFHTRHSSGLRWKSFSGVVTLLLGISILIAPIPSIASLAFLIGAFLFVGGIARTVFAFRLRPSTGWRWILFDGLLSILVAILIVFRWPQGSLAFIGLLTGFWLLSAGAWRLVLARAPA